MLDDGVYMTHTRLMSHNIRILKKKFLINEWSIRFPKIINPMSILIRVKFSILTRMCSVGY